MVLMNSKLFICILYIYTCIQSPCDVRIKLQNLVISDPAEYVVISYVNVHEVYVYWVSSYMHMCMYVYMCVPYLFE